MSITHHENGSRTAEHTDALFRGSAALEAFLAGAQSLRPEVGVAPPAIDAHVRNEPMRGVVAPLAADAHVLHEHIEGNVASLAINAYVRHESMRGDVAPPASDAHVRHEPIRGSVAPAAPDAHVRHEPISSFPRMPERRYGVDKGTHVFGFIQALQPSHVVQEIVPQGVPTWDQHLQVQSGQVILLPIEVCVWLLANQPGLWGQMTVCPPSLVLGQDGSTGLDTAGAASTATWGVDARGFIYFTPDGDMGSGERADMFVQAGVPFLIR